MRRVKSLLTLEDAVTFIDRVDHFGTWVAIQRGEGGSFA